MPGAAAVAASVASGPRRPVGAAHDTGPMALDLALIAGARAIGSAFLQRLHRHRLLGDRPIRARRFNIEDITRFGGKLDPI